ncbi:Copper resistance protein A precursor [Mycobacterium marinum]|nr:Copper resistance protein A precursor [Mycobacterium marinum]
MTTSSFDRVQVNRRAFVGATLAGGLTLAACSGSPSRAANSNAAMGSAVAAAEAGRPHSGRVVTASLTPQPATVDLGGTLARTLVYGTGIPGPLIRANVGDELEVTLANRLDHATSVHWHGIALRNDMDGPTPATPNIEAGKDFTYRFSLPHPGTYWAHPHTGLDADYGLYLPVIVDDPAEPRGYDAEWIVVLDDWTDGIGKTPKQLYEDLRAPTKRLRRRVDRGPR